MNCFLSLKTIGRLELVTAGGLLVFWLLFFTVGLAPHDPPPGYFAFEHSFPVPDIVLALVLIKAGTLLQSENVSRQDLGRTLSLGCAGALVFLGLLDVGFNTQNGMYAISRADTVLALVINAWCLGFGTLAGICCHPRGDSDQRDPYRKGHAG